MALVGAPLAQPLPTTQPVRSSILTAPDKTLPARKDAGSNDALLPPPIATATKTPTGRADYILEHMLPHLMPSPDAVDQQVEQNVSREINLTRSAGQLLKPVGFVQIGNRKIVYASEDGKRLMRLTAGSRIGIMKIQSIDEDGVTYIAGQRELHAPLAYLPSDPPTPPDQEKGVAPGGVRQTPGLR